MKITVSQRQFLSKLRLVGKNIHPNKVTPEMENFLFQIVDNTLTVSGTNDNGSITTVVDCSIKFSSGESNSQFTLNAKMLLDALKEIPEQPLTLNIKFQADRVVVVSSYSNGKFELVGGTGETFPTISNPEENALKIEVTSHELYTGLKQTYFRCANDELRPVMNGVYFDYNDAGLIFVATDGSTLALKEYKSSPSRFTAQEMGYEPTVRCSFILPEEMAKILVDILSIEDDSEIQLEVDSKRIVITHTDFTINYRQIEGRYPNYRSVIPQNNDKQCTVRKADIVAALKRVSVFCDKNAHLLKLSLTANQMVLTAQDLNYSTSADETIEAEYSDAKFEIGLHDGWLLEILSNIPSTDVIFYFSEPSRATLIKGVDTTGEVEDLTYLIMPLTL